MASVTENILRAAWGHAAYSIVGFLCRPAALSRRS